MDAIKFIKNKKIKELNSIELRLFLDLVANSKNGLIENFNIARYTDNSSITSRTTVYKNLTSLEEKKLIKKNNKNIKITFDFSE